MFDQAYNILQTSLLENQFAQGGLFLGLVTGVWYFLYRHFNSAARRLFRYFCVSIEMDERDEPYHWVMEWVQEQELCFRVGKFGLKKRGRGIDNRPVAVDAGSSGRKSKRVDAETGLLVPGHGCPAVVRWRGRFVVVTVGREKLNNSSDEFTSIFFQSISVWVAPGNRKAGEEFLEELGEKFAERRKGDVVQSLWTPIYGSWHRNDVPPRPASTVILPNDDSASTLRVCRRFLCQRDKYGSLGIPWRLGLLFSGPAGTGKTSFARAIAAELDLPIYALPLSTIGDGHLASLMSGITAPSILLFEDVDCISTTHRREETESNFPGEKDRLTLSGLLNAIDGVGAIEGRILIMTTNRPETLDEALIRPGRADVHLRFDIPDSDQIVRMVRAFGDHVGCEISPERMIELSEMPSMAALQGELLKEVLWGNEQEA